MTPEQIEANKSRFIELCHEYIQRDGVDRLLNYLEQKTDFYTAPSSASYHLNEEGGLCKHSINVFETAMGIKQHIVVPAINNAEAPFSEAPTDESIAIASLFHDLCKTKFYHKAERWKKDSTGHWVSYPGYEIKDDFPFGHGEKSCLILNQFISLHADELLAIRWHMGMFEMTEQGSGTRMAYRQAMEKSPLVALLQTADMISANIREKTTVWE